MKKLLNNRILVLIISIFILKGIIYSIYIIPPTLGEAPDEVGHFSYVQYIAKEKKLPVIKETRLEDNSYKLYLDYAQNSNYNNIEIEDESFLESPANWISQHPPLYYLCASVVYGMVRLFTSNITILIFAVRMLSVLWGVIFLIYSYKLLEELKVSKIVRESIILFILFSPQIQFYFSTVSNDGLNILLALVGLYYVIKYRYNNMTKDYYKFVITCSLIIITKYTGALVVIPYVIYLLCFSIKSKKFLEVINLYFKGGILALAIISPVFIRNMILYGNPVKVSGNIFEASNNISFSSFLIDFPYLDDIFMNFNLLIGWENFIRPLEIMMIISMCTIFISSLGYISEYQIKKTLKYIFELIFIFWLLKIIIGSTFKTAIFFASIYVIIKIIIFDLEKEKELYRFLVGIVLSVFLIYLMQHYILVKTFNQIRATHGRYYLISVMPFIIIIFNGIYKLFNRIKIRYLLPIITMMIGLTLELLTLKICMGGW